jgi:hypothetical protein
MFSEATETLHTEAYSTAHVRQSTVASGFMRFPAFEVARSPEGAEPDHWRDSRYQKHKMSPWVGVPTNQLRPLSLKQLGSQRKGSSNAINPIRDDRISDLKKTRHFGELFRMRALKIEPRGRHRFLGKERSFPVRQFAGTRRQSLGSLARSARCLALVSLDSAAGFIPSINPVFIFYLSTRPCHHPLSH